MITCTQTYSINARSSGVSIESIESIGILASVSPITSKHAFILLSVFSNQGEYLSRLSYCLKSGLNKEKWHFCYGTLLHLGVSMWLLSIYMSLIIVTSLCLLVYACRSRRSKVCHNP